MLTCVSLIVLTSFQTAPQTYDSVRDGLKSSYVSSLEPLESRYLFHQFHSPRLRDPDFDYKPSVMLIGQYSTGKVCLLPFAVIVLG